MSARRSRSQLFNQNAGYPVSWDDPLAVGLIRYWPLSAESGLTTLRDATGFDLGVAPTAITGTPTWAGGPFGSVLNFDGSSSITVPYQNPVLTNKVSVSCWINPSVLTRGDLVNCWNFNDSTSQFNLAYGYDTGFAQFDVCNGTTGGSSQTAAFDGFSPSMVVGTWYHLCGVYDGAIAYIYFNSVLQSSNTLSYTMPTSSLQSIRIGGISDPLFATCKMAKVGIWNRALTAGEIGQLYSEPWRPIYSAARRIVATSSTLIFVDYPVGLESLSPSWRDYITGVEAIAVSRRDHVAPVETVGVLRWDQVEPAEVASTSRYDSLAPSEQLYASKRDLIQPAETVGNVRLDDLATIEQISTMRTDFPLSTEWLYAAKRDHIVPVEVTGLWRSDYLLPIETMAISSTIWSDNNVPLETTGAVRRDLMVPAETTGNVRSDSLAGFESLVSVSADFLIGVERLYAAKRDHIAPAEALAVSRRDILAPVGTTGTYQTIQWDNSVPLEITGIARGDVVQSTEATGNVRPRNLAAIEWIRAVGTDFSAAIEWLAVLRSAGFFFPGPPNGVQHLTLLRQNTQTIINVGPLVGSDFLTVQPAVALAATHAELFQAGATAAIDISTRTWAHIAGGVYQLTLSSGDLSVLGPLLINIHAAATAPFAVRCDVLTQAAYDTFCGGGSMPSNLTQVFGNSTAAVNISQSALGIVPVTLQAGATTITLPTNLTSAISQFYVGRSIVFLSGALSGQSAAVTGYNGATKQLTVSALTNAPATGDTAVIV